MDEHSLRLKQNSYVTESYRKLAVNIEYANIDGNIKTIMITSSMANEGKSTTISNLACVMTELNKRVILMDLDLRKPSVHKYFNLSNNSGLTDLLLNKNNYKNYIHNIQPGLDVMTSGRVPSNTTEIIISKAIKELLKDLSENYDYILLDTPPIMLVSDPVNIAIYADAVILAIAYAETDKETIKKTIDVLKQVNANIIGTVLNKVPQNKKNKYYYYY
ncbi:CpsD/CapB family tyrosine-protein kinase [Sedimentibacter saalensis]|uniref:CpsD/CapB family tyrosine-protein kinase n=1 Tax=Sedimentibacter saalensis TaxID=130788 RepID=UPI0011A6258E|nr:CpsD/CapB family tyrosine-protein kinase [Sedimentibacter saalensis]